MPPVGDAVFWQRLIEATSNIPGEAGGDCRQRSTAVSPEATSNHGIAEPISPLGALTAHHLERVEPAWLPVIGVTTFRSGWIHRRPGRGPA